MPYSGEIKNAMEAAALSKTNPSINTAYVSLGTQTEYKPAKEAAISQKVIEVTGAPATGTIVCLTEVNGKTVAGEAAGPFIVGAFYYVRKKGTNEVNLAFTKAQAETSEAECLEITVAIKTTTKLMAITEAGVTARIATSFGTPANGKGEDGTAREVESNTSQTVHWVIYFSASSSGTFAGGTEVTERTMANGDIFKVTKTIGESTGA
jgi:hypothetical protein